MKALVYRLDTRHIIAIVEKVETHDGTNIIGQGGHVKGLDTTQAAYVILSDDYEALEGDVLPESIVDQRDHLPKSLKDQLAEARETIKQLQNENATVSQAAAQNAADLQGLMDYLAETGVLV